ncbi:MAG: CehA/McbA family metallohydrolase [Nannocystaceae bacterium]
MLGARLAVLLVAVASCSSGGEEGGPGRRSAEAPAAAVAGPAAAPRETYLKGQLHLHSAASGDSDTPAADVVRWYADAGFDFIVFTDHNRITAPPRDAGDLLVFPGVELTQNLDACEPAPEPGLQCLLHVNALFVDPARGELLVSRPLPPSVRRVDRYSFAAALSGDLGGLALLNHPNFHYGADASVIRGVAQALAEAGRGPLLLEVANMAIDSNNGGDAAHPSTEALWDEVLSAGHRVYGVATDDAHHYYDAAARVDRGEEAFVGDRGFVMVRAARDEEAIRAALVRGDFYASDGLLLDRAEVSGDALVIQASAGAAAPVTTRFIAGGGALVREVVGDAARLELSAVAGSAYVRAEVVDADGKRAWVQPVWLDPGS